VFDGIFLNHRLQVTFDVFFLRRCRIKVTVDVEIKVKNATAASMFISVYEVCAVLGVGLGFSGR